MSHRRSDSDDTPQTPGPPEPKDPPAGVFNLPNGLQVTQDRIYEPEVYPDEVIGYDITDIEPGSGWDIVGVSPGDRIMSANRLRFAQLDLEEQLDLMRDPDAELNLLIQMPGGGSYNVYVSLNEALESGLPDPGTAPGPLGLRN